MASKHHADWPRVFPLGSNNKRFFLLEPIVRRFSCLDSKSQVRFRIMFAGVSGIGVMLPIPSAWISPWISRDYMLISIAKSVNNEPPCLAAVI